MAVAIGNKTSAYNAAVGTSLTIPSFLIGAGQTSLLVMLTAKANGAYIYNEAVTCGGLPLELVGKTNLSTYWISTTFFVLESPPIGSSDVVITWANNCNMMASVFSFTGALKAEASSYRATTAGGGDHTLSISSKVGDMVMGACIMERAGSGSITEISITEDYMMTRIPSNGYYGISGHGHDAGASPTQYIGWTTTRTGFVAGINVPAGVPTTFIPHIFAII